MGASGRKVEHSQGLSESAKSKVRYKKVLYRKGTASKSMSYPIGSLLQLHNDNALAP
jgi:hypothetical protein